MLADELEAIALGKAANCLTLAFNSVAELIRTPSIPDRPSAWPSQA